MLNEQGGRVDAAFSEVGESAQVSYEEAKTSDMLKKKSAWKRMALVALPTGDRAAEGIGRKIALRNHSLVRPLVTGRETLGSETPNNW